MPATSGTAPRATASTTSRPCRPGSPRSPQELGDVGLADEPPGTFRRIVIEKPFGHDLESAQALDDQLHAVLPRAPDLPHRPLPGQGDGAEHPGAAVRERDLRAALEPALRRPRRADRGRVARRRPPGHVLRARRRAARHRAEPPAAGARGHGDGAARELRGRRGARREGEAAARDPPAAAVGPPPARRARAVRRGRGRRRDGARRTATRRASTRTAPPRRSSRSGWRSTTGGGRACRSSCAPGSTWSGA